MCGVLQGQTQRSYTGWVPTAKDKLLHLLAKTSRRRHEEEEVEEGREEEEEEEEEGSLCKLHGE